MTANNDGECQILQSWRREIQLRRATLEQQLVSFLAENTMNRLTAMPANAVAP
jgi:hypothetical protein